MKERARTIEEAAGDEIAELILDRLARLDQPMSAVQAARRLLTIAEALTSGKPPVELFALAAAVAIKGAAASAAADLVRRLPELAPADPR